MAKTILAIGAHYDDCVFGIPGILLQAIRKNHRVVILSLIGDYSNWRPVKGREKALIDGTKRLCGEFGVEIRFRFRRDDFRCRSRSEEAGRRSRCKDSARRRVHAVAARSAFRSRSGVAIVEHALKHADRLIAESIPYRAPSPGLLVTTVLDTIDFEPNTFVDITDDWPRATEWLGRLMALARNTDYDPLRQDGAVRAKESLARYRGGTCGVQYAEALRSFNEYPQDIL